MTPRQEYEEAREALLTAESIAVLTGAGVSAASGVPTFRGAEGLWKNLRAQDLATPQAYARDPQLVWEWYAMRFHKVMRAQPNKAHNFLAKLETKTPHFTLVTQNVDGLHGRAGSRNIQELHGNLTKSRCERCGNLDALPLDFPLPPRCSVCGSRARPNVVWFGEMLPSGPFEQAIGAFEKADVALIVGTSAVVEPAASLGRLAARHGAFVVEVNPEETPLSHLTHLSVRENAVDALAKLEENS